MRSSQDISGNPAQPTASTTTSATPDPGPPRDPVSGEQPGNGSTDTIAALTVALLAVLIILSLLVICRAIRKRRQAQQGQELTHIPTISTGVMGTPVAAYGNIAIQGRISWESVQDTAATPADNDPVPGSSSESPPSI